jgi:hypothetical protein
VPEPVRDLPCEDEVRAPDGSNLIDEEGDAWRYEEDGEETADPHVERDDWDPPYDARAPCLLRATPGATL